VCLWRNFRAELGRLGQPVGSRRNRLAVTRRARKFDWLLADGAKTPRAVQLTLCSPFGTSPRDNGASDLRRSKQRQLDTISESVTTAASRPQQQRFRMSNVAICHRQSAPGSGGGGDGRHRRVRLCADASDEWPGARGDRARPQRGAPSAAARHSCACNWKCCARIARLAARAPSLITSGSAAMGRNNSSGADPHSRPACRGHCCC
jgi:hypothetical protein